MNHINKKGNPHIVDVSNKDITERLAIASGEVKFDTRPVNLNTLTNHIQPIPPKKRVY